MPDVVATLGGGQARQTRTQEGQSVSMERQRALRTIALSVAKQSSMGLKSGL